MRSARNNRRRYRRRGRFGFLYKMLAVIAVTVAFIMGIAVFFRVETVSVVGNSRYSAQEIIEVSKVEQGSNLFRINKFEMARRIRKGLPYVDAVNIRRGLPDTLIITVSECRAAAQIASESGQWLISKSGKQLEPAGQESVDVVKVTGLELLQPEAGAAILVREEEQERCDQLLQLLQAMDECELLDRVSEIDMKSSVRILMELDDRFTVRLPMNGDFVYLLRAMDKAVQSLDDYETGTLDLTVKDYTVVFSPA